MAKPSKNIFYFLLSLLYGAITELRNLLFNWRILRSVSFELPVISIGNLAVGGTGKTPHTELLLKSLSEEWKTAVLSRGYKRETKGLRIAHLNDTAKTIGDEPFQIYSKFPHTMVAVDEKRVHGIRYIIGLKQGIELFLLDDAYQHRHVSPGLSILLTDFQNLYTDDFMLPYGTLREKCRNSKRADIIIVTKCKPDLRIEDMALVEQKLKIKPYQTLFFSTFVYKELYPALENNMEKVELTPESDIVLLTGIEKPQDMLRYLEKKTRQIETLFYPDHHNFTEEDLRVIEAKVINEKENRIIITTEKDFSRLKSNIHLSRNILNKLFVLPIEVKILNNEHEIFIQKIKHYVSENSRNS